MSVVSESESNTTLVDAVSGWNIQSEGLGIRAADTPIPSAELHLFPNTLLEKTILLRT